MWMELLLVVQRGEGRVCVTNKGMSYHSLTFSIKKEKIPAPYDLCFPIHFYHSQQPKGSGEFSVFLLWMKDPLILGVVIVPANLLTKIYFVLEICRKFENCEYLKATNILDETHFF